MFWEQSPHNNLVVYELDSALHIFKKSNFCSSVWQIQWSTLWCRGWYHSCQVPQNLYIRGFLCYVHDVEVKYSINLQEYTHACLTSNAVCTPQVSPLPPLHNGIIPCQGDLVSPNLVHNFNFLYQNDKKQIFSLHNNTERVTTCLCIHYLTSWNLLMLLVFMTLCARAFKGTTITWLKY